MSLGLRSIFWNNSSCSEGACARAASVVSTPKNALVKSRLAINRLAASKPSRLDFAACPSWHAGPTENDISRQPPKFQKLRTTMAACFQCHRTAFHDESGDPRKKFQGL